MVARVSILVAVLVSSALSPIHAAWSATDVVASKALTIQADGPRTGSAGSQFFNIEGKDNGKYASFGILVFELPKDVDLNKVKSLTLTLTQTTPKFAKPGAIKIYLVPDLDLKAALKFDAQAANGVVKQIETLHELAADSFKDPKPDHAQKITLKWDVVKEQIAKGGALYLVIAPADAAVAATYRGVDEKAKDKSPKLTLE